MGGSINGSTQNAWFTSETRSIFPMDDGRSATRCLVTAVKGAERKPEIRTRLTLHNPDGSFTDTVQAILRDAAPAPILTEEDRTS